MDKIRECIHNLIGNLAFNKSTDADRARRKSRYKRLVLVLSAIMVFVTTYMLILPAMTLERNAASKQGGIDLPAAEEDASDYEAVDADETADEKDDHAQSEHAEEHSHIDADAAGENDGNGASGMSDADGSNSDSGRSEDISGDADAAANNDSANGMQL